jgi:O-antigen ligase
MPESARQESMESLEVPRAVQLLPLTIAGLALLLLLFTNELITGILLASLIGVALSFSVRVRLYILVALLPLAHAGLGVKGFGGLGIFDLWLAWIVFLFLCRTVFVNGWDFSMPRPLQVSLLMMLAFLPSAVLTVSAADTAKAFAQLLLSVLAAAAVYEAVRRSMDADSLYRLFWVVILAAGLVSLIGLYQATRGSLFAVATGRAFFRYFSDVNYYAGYLLMALAICIGLLMTERRLAYRFLLAGIALSMMIAIIATVSRSALAILLLMVVVYAASFVLQRRAQTLVSLSLIASLVGVVGVLLLTDIGSRVVDLFTLSRRIETVIVGRDASLQQRQNIASVTVDMIKDNPLLGVGFGAFEQSFDRYKGGYLSTGSKRSAHNTFLRVLAETGVFGFIAFLYFVWVLMRSLWVSYRRLTNLDQRTLMFALFLSLGSFILMSVSLDQMFEPHFWVLCGVALAYGELTTRTTISGATEGA